MRLKRRLNRNDKFSLLSTCFVLSFRQIRMATFQCHHQMLLGPEEDGGWQVCVYGDYDIRKPCLVYSFGWVATLLCSFRNRRWFLKCDADWNDDEFSPTSSRKGDSCLCNHVSQPPPLSSDHLKLTPLRPVKLTKFLPLVFCSPSPKVHSRLVTTICNTCFSGFRHGIADKIQDTGASFPDNFHNLNGLKWLPDLWIKFFFPTKPPTEHDASRRFWDLFFKKNIHSQPLWIPGIF